MTAGGRREGPELSQPDGSQRFPPRASPPRPLPPGYDVPKSPLPWVGLVLPPGIAPAGLGVSPGVPRERGPQMCPPSCARTPGPPKPRDPPHPGAPRSLLGTCAAPPGALPVPGAGRTRSARTRLPEPPKLRERLGAGVWPLPAGQLGSLCRARLQPEHPVPCPRRFQRQGSQIPPGAAPSSPGSACWGSGPPATAPKAIKSFQRCRLRPPPAPRAAPAVRMLYGVNTRGFVAGSRANNAHISAA